MRSRSRNSLSTRFARLKWWRFSPSQILEKMSAYRFDRRYGTDTSTFAELSTLGIASTNRRHGERYQPSPVYSLRGLLRRLCIDYSTFTFIDFGSGKGRTLLIAGEMPFRQVIGIEFSHELHQLAERNIELYTRRAAQHVGSVHLDATRYALPLDDLVLYFFNPFQKAVLDQVIGKINASLRSRPRKVILIYLYLPDQAWLSQLEGFRLRAQWRNYRVIEYTPPPRDAQSV
jgi:hypothetical protein